MKKSRITLALSLLVTLLIGCASQPTSKPTIPVATKTELVSATGVTETPTPKPLAWFQCDGTIYSLVKSERLWTETSCSNTGIFNFNIPEWSTYDLNVREGIVHGEITCTKDGGKMVCEGKDGFTIIAIPSN